MEDRIPCTNPGCPHLILPDTAARNHGLCTPCVQAAAKRARDEYIRQNRRDLDEFVGVTDPVEILQIIHRPRKHDPLVRWLPHPTPVAQLYTALSEQEARRLAGYATALLGTDRHPEAENIILPLAAFTNVNLDECLRAMTSQGYFRPSLPFHRAPAELRDDLLVRVESGDGNRNHLLQALAWIGDAAVVERFARWRSEPPAWKESLFIPPQDYSREAGWELTAQGGKRNLFFPACVELLPGVSTQPASFVAIQERADACPWCRSRLTNLFAVDDTAFDLASGADRLGSVQVATCEVCTAFRTVFGMLDEAGHGRWHTGNTRPDYLPDDAATWSRLPVDALTPGRHRSPFFAANQFLPTTFSQLGGHPTWIQDAEYPRCPDCKQTMMFLAQVDHADIEKASEGMYYAFVCPSCRTTATTYQQT